MATKATTVVKATAKTGTIFVLESTEQRNLFVHYATILSDNDFQYCLKNGIEDAKNFTQTQLDKFLDTLPENNGLQVVEVE